MAITFSSRVGKTRIRLAKILNIYFPDYEFLPENLDSQIPIYASAKFDNCSWTGSGKLKRNPSVCIVVHSWDTMTKICRNGIHSVDKDFEIYANSEK
jgi:hypothetical protein